MLVTGATGAVGPCVVQALCNAGLSVRTFSMDVPKTAWGSEVETLIGDVTDPVAVQSAMNNVDAVVHLAALLHIVNPPPELRQKYEKINVGGTATVVAAALKANVRRVVFASTIAVYGPPSSQGQPLEYRITSPALQEEAHGQSGCHVSKNPILDENTLPQPDTFYARTKLAAEKIVLNARDSDGQAIGTVLRFGAVYGARIKGNYERLMRALAGKRFIPIGDGTNRRTLVYDKDVANAIVLAVQHPDAAGKVYNVTDGQFHELREIIAAICAALGRRPPRISIPIGLARFMVGMVEDMMRLTGRQSPINRTTIDKYTEDVAVDGQRIQKELGFVPQYDLASGWRETVKHQPCI